MFTILTKKTAPYRGPHQLQTLLENFDHQLVNLEKLLQPALPPIKKKPKMDEHKSKSGLDTSILEEISRDANHVTRYNNIMNLQPPTPSSCPPCAGLPALPPTPTRLPPTPCQR